MTGTIFSPGSADAETRSFNLERVITHQLSPHRTIRNHGFELDSV